MRHINNSNSCLHCMAKWATRCGRFVFMFQIRPWISYMCVYVILFRFARQPPPATTSNTIRHRHIFNDTHRTKCVPMHATERFSFVFAFIMKHFNSLVVTNRNKIKNKYQSIRWWIFVIKNRGEFTSQSSMDFKCVRFLLTSACFFFALSRARYSLLFLFGYWTVCDEWAFDVALTWKSKSYVHQFWIEKINSHQFQR